MIILAVSAANIGLHIWPDALEPSFGFDGWRAIGQGAAPGLLRAHVVLLALALLPAALGWHRLHERLPWSRLQALSGARAPIASPLLLGLLWLLAIALFWMLRAPVTLGDGQYIAQKMVDQRYFGFRWYMAYAIILGLYRTVGAALSLSPLDSLQLTSAIAGATTVVLLVKIVGHLFRERYERWLFLGLLPSAYGPIQLWFGYAEVYPLVLLGWTALVWVYLLVLDGRRSPAWASALSGVVYLLYIGNILLLPAYGLLMIVTARRLPAGRTRIQGVLTSLLVLAGTIALCLSWKLGIDIGRFWAIQVASANITMGTASGSVLYSAASLLSRQHLKEFINEWALVDASGLLLTLLAPWFWLRSLPHDGSLQRDLRAYLLAAIALPGVAYSFLMEPLLGYPQDWDLFAYLGLFTLLLGAYVLIKSRRRLPLFRPAYSALAASGWLHLVLTLPPFLAS